MRRKPTTQGKEVDAMGDQESDRGQPLDERLRSQLQDWLGSQGDRIESLARQIQEQAGHMWQEFEKRLQSLDDARQALEDRITRQIDNLLTQQRSFARRLQSLGQQAATSRGKSPARKAAKRTTAKRGAKKASARRPAARKSPSKKSTKRSTAKRSAKR